LKGTLTPNCCFLPLQAISDILDGTVQGRFPMIRSFSRTAAMWLRAVVAFVFVVALVAARSAQAGSVTDCGDTPAATTTLRGVMASAADNDVIDVSQCSAIVLLGEISTALNLTIQGPLDGSTTIDASTNGRAIVDTGALSILTLDHVLIEHGRAPGLDPVGGCVLATYEIHLQNSTLSDCAATTNDGTARGGAVNAAIVNLTSSVVEGSTASSANKDAQGGGVYAGSFFCTNSLVRDNAAVAGDFLIGHAYGGGVYSPGSMSVTGCTFAGNQASDSGGGIWGSSVFMINSTVSGNSATYNVGGIAANSATISNSTIAFNQGGTCGGLFAGSVGYINSTILANNSAQTPSACHDVNAPFGSGTSNILGVADAGVTLPGDTHVGDPQLTPLAYHGGLTPTHALSTTSYAVDHGNNANMADTDQRGSGYARVVNGIADVGAYERQLVDDEIFYSGME
jgi:hypothetical protein